MAKTFIGIRLEVEGIHCYPTASKDHGEEVMFLENPHRHLFKINCKKQVFHDNRDKEFILLKRQVKDYINSKFTSVLYRNCCDFGAMSCESIAKHILEYFDFDSVEVSEDGENYAIVEKDYECDCRPESIEEEQSSQDEPKPFPHIVFVVGEAFSGKTTYVKKVMKEDEAAIEIGDMVREIKGEKRTFNGNLDDKIVAQCMRCIFETDPLSQIKKLYIVGCRQKSVFDKILQYLSDRSYEVDYEVVFLFVSREIRKNRFLKDREEEKNKGLSFEEIERGDRAVGLKEFTAYLFTEEVDRSKVTIEINE